MLSWQISDHLGGQHTTAGKSYLTNQYAYVVSSNQSYQIAGNTSMSFTSRGSGHCFISDFCKKNMNWLILIVAGLFEVGFASCLGKAKQVSGTEAAWWYAGFAVCLTISMILLIKATQSIPIGTAYAVWTGVGAVGTVIVGIFFFQEPADFWRILFLSLLIGSIVGLKAVS
jgi:quaternary ammonium compound-resistance protein SugE